MDENSVSSQAYALGYKHAVFGVSTSILSAAERPDYERGMRDGNRDEAAKANPALRYPLEVKSPGIICARSEYFD